MSLVRRILIALTALALIANAGALVLIKTNAGPAPSEDKSKLVFWIDDGDQAGKAEEVLKAEGYETLLKPADREDFVDANFRVVMPGENKILKPVASSLARSGHKNLSFSKDGTKLYYGGVFTSKSEAKRVAKSLEAKEKFIFDVEPGKKKVKKSSHRLILTEVPRNYVTILEETLRDASVDTAKTVETPINWKPDKGGSGDSTEEE